MLPAHLADFFLKKKKHLADIARTNDSMMKACQNPRKEKKWLAKGNEDIGILKLNTWIRQTCGIEEKNCS